MGSHGPVPKRKEERRRQNKPETPVTTVKTTGKVKAPSADPEWHPLAGDLYRSFKKSGQTRFWEPSDWQTARVQCHLLSVELRKTKPSPAMIGNIFSALARLGVTEGDRRRMGIEIERDQAKPKLAEVSVMDEYRHGLGG